MNGIVLGIVAIIVAAYLFSQIAKFLKLPAVLGQLSAGFILAIPFINEAFFPPESFQLFSFLAEIGILLMFFLAGLGLRLDKKGKDLKLMISISLLNTTIPLVAGFLAAYFIFSFGLVESLFIGAALAVSSQAISYRILDEAGMANHRIAAFIVGSGIVDDVIEFIILTLLLTFFGVIITEPADLAIGIVLFVAVVLFFRFYLIQFILERASHEPSQATYFMASMVIILLMAHFASLFGISSFLAAIISGIIVRQILMGLPDLRNVGKSISSTVKTAANGFFVPIFFVWAGMNAATADFDTGAILLIITLIFIDIAGTLAGTMIAMLGAGKKMNDAIIVAMGVVPKGDTELALAVIALDAGIINHGIYSSIIIMAFIVTIISSTLFRHLLSERKKTMNHNGALA
ncbi:cation:proton antiporter [Candidatus Micrarchaeota archaeon]|nr:cation:proton antiporter [Candidatus Micrarchaeota archaeon]